MRSALHFLRHLYVRKRNEENHKRHLLIGASLRGMCQVWPALYTETKVSALPIIGLSLVLEYLAIRHFFKRTVKESILGTAIANLVSGLLGTILRPLSGIAYELSLGMLINWAFGRGTFNPVAWFFVPIVGGAVNAIVELFTLKLIWKMKLKKENLFTLWAVNWFTVGIATLWVVLYPPQL